MWPFASNSLLQPIDVLTGPGRVSPRRCIAGLEADVQKCESNIEKSLAMCTALAPVIGYDQAAKIAKVAYDSGRTVREVAAELSGLDRARLDQLLDPSHQTGPVD